MRRERDIPYNVVRMLMWNQKKKVPEPPRLAGLNGETPEKDEGGEKALTPNRTT